MKSGKTSNPLNLKSSPQNTSDKLVMYPPLFYILGCFLHFGNDFRNKPFTESIKQSAVALGKLLLVILDYDRILLSKSAR